MSMSASRNSGRVEPCQSVLRGRLLWRRSLAFAKTVFAVAAASFIAVAPATAGQGWLRDPTPGVSVLGGPSGSSGSGAVMHDTNPHRRSNTYVPQRGRVRRYGSRGSTSSILDSVKPKDAKKLTDNAASLYWQALADDKNGKYNDAVLKLRKSLAIREFYWRDQDKNIPVVLVKLAEILGKQKKYDEAVGNLDRSLWYCSRIFGPGTIERVPTLVLLGQMYQRKSDSAKSFESYKQAYMLTERAKGKCAETTKLTLSMARVAKSLNWRRTTCQLYQELLDNHASGIGGLSQAELSAIAQDYSDILKKDGRQDEANAILAKVGVAEQPPPVPPEGASSGGLSSEAAPAASQEAVPSRTNSK